MNICLVSKEFYPCQKAGIAVYISNLSNMLIKGGHRVFLVTDYNNIKKIEPKKYGMEFIGVDPYKSGDIFAEYELAYSLEVKNVLEDLVKKEKIDIIEFADYFGEGFFAVLYKKVCGVFREIPLIVKLHTPSYECNVANGLSNGLSELTLQEDYTIENCDALYAISHFMKNDINNRLHCSEIDVVYNPIFLPKTKKNSNNADYLNVRTILYVGRLEPRKGIDLFINAAIRLLKNDEKIIIKIVGKDTNDSKSGISMKEQLIETIPAELRKHFVWLDVVAHDMLVNFYQEAYFCVFPSRYEGFGNVCVEAMGCGTPVIVSSQTGLAEVVDQGKYGIVFDNSSNEDLYQNMKNLLKNTELREKLSELSKKRSQAFLPEACYKKQVQYYETVIKSYKKKNNLNICSEILLVKLIENMKKNYRSLFDQLKNERDSYKNERDSYKNECERILGEWEKLRAENGEMKQSIICKFFSKRS